MNSIGTMGTSTKGPLAPARTLVECGLLGLSLIACGGNPDSAHNPVGPSFDTLANGSVLVTNPPEGLWARDPEARWRVVEALRIGTSQGMGPRVFGEIKSIVVDQADRLWVVDGQANEIRVFDHDGNFVRSVGRTGEGPGEFRRIGPAYPGPDGEIWVEDLGLARFEVFDTSGARTGGHRLLSQLRGGLRRWTEEGLFVVADVDPRQGRTYLKIYERGADGVLDSVGVLEPPDIQLDRPTTVVFEYPGPPATVIEVPVPFSRATGVMPGRVLDWWLACGLCGESSYDLVRVSSVGDTLLTIRRNFTSVAIPDSTREAALASLSRYSEGATKISPRLNLGLVPLEYPPFVGGLRVFPDGSVWVGRMEEQGAAFDVFDREGRYLGQPEVPVDFGQIAIHAITDHSMYGVDLDELGVNYVVRLDVRRTPDRGGNDAEPRTMRDRVPAERVDAADGEAKTTADAAADKGAQRHPQGLEPRSDRGLDTVPKPVNQEAFRDCPSCPWMMEVPPGGFLMGTPDQGSSAHHVEIETAFAVGVYEVTFAEWDTCVVGGGCGGWSPQNVAGRTRRGSWPVMQVSWHDAQSYTEWLSDQTGERYRLLSEAEWEYVARAGGSSSRPWGDTASEQCRYANGYDQTTHDEWPNRYQQPVPCVDGFPQTAPVGSFPANGFGLHDLLGNINEWTQDCWNESYKGSPRDGGAWEAGRCDHRVARGGSFYSEGDRIRVSARQGLGSTLRSLEHGFRVARSVRAR